MLTVISFRSTLENTAPTPTPVQVSELQWISFGNAFMEKIDFMVLDFFFCVKREPKLLSSDSKM